VGRRTFQDSVRPEFCNLPIYRKDAAGEPCLQVLREPLFELRASFTLGEQLYSFLDFRERDDAYMLGLAIRGLQPALDARVGTSRPVVFRQNIRIDEENRSSKINRAGLIFGSLQIKVGAGKRRIEEEVR
jgi:hypothetical protein